MMHATFEATDTWSETPLTRMRMLRLSIVALALVPAATAWAASHRHRQPSLAADARPLARVQSQHTSSLGRHDDENDEDPTAISSDPNVSAMCQSLIGRLNVYGNPKPNIDTISDDALVSSGSQSGCNAAQNGPSIAVNPEIPSNLVAGASDYRIFNTREQRNDGSAFAYVSFDGGKTWSNARLPHLTLQTGATGALAVMDATGEPAIAFGPHNVVYYASTVFSRSQNANGIAVSKSNDGGRTWGEPILVRVDGVDSAGRLTETENFNDRSAIAVDQRSGAVYVSWTRFGPDEQGFSASPIVVSRSADGGKSWSKFSTANPASNFKANGVTPFAQGSSPQIGLQGELYVAYEAAICKTLACDTSSDHDAIVVATSFDGGRSFINTEVAADFDFPLNEDAQHNTLSNENFRVNSLPQMTIDPLTGKLYVVWADDRNGEYRTSGESLKTNGDVFIAGSFDGFHWSQPRQIGGLSDDFFPSVAALGGQVAVAFYTRNFDANGIGLDVAVVSALDSVGLNGLAHARLRRVTTETTNPQIQFAGVGVLSGKILQGVFIGDRLSTAMGRDGIVHACWTDFRGKPGAAPPSQDVYTQAIRFGD